MDRQPMRIASTPHASPAMVSCSPTLSAATISAWNRSPRLRLPASAYAAMQSAECPCPSLGSTLSLGRFPLAKRLDNVARQVVIPTDSHPMADTDWHVEGQHRAAESRRTPQTISAWLQLQREDPATVIQLATDREEDALPHRHRDPDILFRFFHPIGLHPA